MSHYTYPIPQHQKNKIGLTCESAMLIKTCNSRSCKCPQDLSILAIADRALVAKRF